MDINITIPQATVDRLVEAEAVKIAHESAERYIAASLTDPDIIAKSGDWQDGYAQGVREMSLAAVKMLLKRNA